MAEPLGRARTGPQKSAWFTSGDGGRMRTEVFWDKSDPQNEGWAYRASLMDGYRVLTYHSGGAESAMEAQSEANLAANYIAKEYGFDCEEGE